MRPLLFRSLVLGALLLATFGCSSKKHAVPQSATTRPGADLPRIHEGFTVLPCPRNATRGTTIGAEGCAERQILHTDAKIRAAERAIFARLSAKGRSVFASGERSWLAYREAYCNARASSYAGGSVAPVIFGTCTAGVNRDHLSSLSAFRRELWDR